MAKVRQNIASARKSRGSDQLAHSAPRSATSSTARRNLEESGAYLESMGSRTYTMRASNSRATREGQITEFHRLTGRWPTRSGRLVFGRRAEAARMNMPYILAVFEHGTEAAFDRDYAPSGTSVRSAYGRFRISWRSLKRPRRSPASAGHTSIVQIEGLINE